jgi:hypothetical protein
MAESLGENKESGSERREIRSEKDDNFYWEC